MGKWIVLVVLSAAQFLMVLDQAVMNVAISQLVEDFDTTVTTIQAVIALYALVMAGLMLTGTEVKSARDGHVQLGQAYADIRDGEAWLIGASISEYAQGGPLGHQSDRDRKLLLHRGEIDSLYGKVREKGRDRPRPRPRARRQAPRRGRAGCAARHRAGAEATPLSLAAPPTRNSLGGG